jgi:hypothetical protein
MRAGLGTLVLPLMLTFACGSSTDTGGSKPGSDRDGGSGGATAGTGGATAGTGGASTGGASTGSGGAGGSTANGGSSGGTGTGGAPTCPGECLVANECVARCGDTPESFGCCPCPSDMIDARSCMAIDAGGSGGSPGTVSCDPKRVLCKIATPSCPDLYVPSVVGSCYGPCVPIDTCPCAQASDCPDSNQYTCLMSKGTCTPYL